RNNPAGSHREFWQHVTGCRQWLVVERDTRNHIIQSVGFARKTARKMPA
ncbi:sarcosine oxidase subunit delta, partial [Mesorhizobium sp. USDA-HM6]